MKEDGSFLGNINQVPLLSQLMQKSKGRSCEYSQKRNRGNLSMDQYTASNHSMRGPLPSNILSEDCEQERMNENKEVASEIRKIMKNRLKFHVKMLQGDEMTNHAMNNPLSFHMNQISSTHNASSLYPKKVLKLCHRRTNSEIERAKKIIPFKSIMNEYISRAKKSQPNKIIGTNFSMSKPLD